tara:strand:+ start:3374 stop:4294 length:921 start_codon:yes stop_codon:yes gene_type:complete
MYKVLVAPTSFGTISSEPIKKLQSKKIKIIFNDTKSVLTKQQIISLSKDCDGIIAGTEKYDDEIFDQLLKLKVVSRLGVGVDNIDLNALKKRDIILKITKEHPSVAVAELVIGLIINLLRNISLSDKEIRLSIWNKQMGSLLSGKTIGIIGLGKIGRELVRLLKPFKVKILINDIKHEKDFLQKYDCEFSSLESLISNSDIISVHMNSSEENKEMFNEKIFKKMKDTALFINTSRGSLVNENDLIKALNLNQIAGAALDVFKEEPYKGNLIKLNNLIMTPHIGSYAKEIRNRMEIEAAENIIDILS